MPAPATTPTAIVGTGAHPCLTLSTVITPAAKPLTEPTDRSISPSSSTSTAPIETSRDLERQRREVERGQEAAVGDLEDRPDYLQFQQDPRQRQIALDEPADHSSGERAGVPSLSSPGRSTCV
jgi:hypothetical protein